MSEAVEDVALEVEGKRFRFWDDLEVNLHLDAFSTAAFVAPMDPDRPEFRSVFRPFSYAPVTITTNEEDLFAGTMLMPEPTTTPEGRTVKAQCVSKPAVLEDCTFPAEAYPIEFNGLRLADIAAESCRHFGLEVAPLDFLVMQDDAPFARVEAESDKHVHEFLVDLAKQRNLLVSDTPDGRLALVRPLPAGLPVQVFVEGQAPLGPVSVVFSPQEYYSSITGLGTKKIGGKGGRHTETNTLASGLNRPLAFRVDNTESASLPQAVKARLGRMFGALASYTWEVPTWRNAAGNLWRPNQIVSLMAPGAMVYQPTPLLLRSVTLRQTKETRVALLSAVLLGSFTGEIPKVLPWG